MSSELNPPTDCRYADTHEWCRLEDNVAVVGITDFAAAELTDVTHVELVVKPGDAIKKGQKFGEIESVKAFSDLYAPVSGTVKAINEAFEDDDNAALVNSSSFGDGWMLKIEVSDAKELDGLLDAEGYKKLVSGGN